MATVRRSRPALLTEADERLDDRGRTKLLGLLAVRTERPVLHRRSERPQARPAERKAVGPREHKHELQAERTEQPVSLVVAC
jgi:hypothetical protein